MSDGATACIVVKNLHFDPRTAPLVTHLVAKYCDQPMRVRIDYGNAETGESWSVEDAVEGYICSSGGAESYPLLLPTTRSNAGSPIKTENIVALWETEGNRVYKHKSYTPKYDWKNARYARCEANRLQESPWQIFAKEWKDRKDPDAKEHNPASFATEGQAIRWLNKKRKFETP